MTNQNAAGNRPANNAIAIEIAGLDLNFKVVDIADSTPTGAQIAAAAEVLPDNDPFVLRFLDDGELVPILASEVAPIDGVNDRFVVTSADRAYRLKVDGEQYDWPAQYVTGKTVRKLAGIANDLQLMLAVENEPDKVIGNRDLVDLAGAGVERFYTVRETWKIKVQDTVIQSDLPIIKVRDAMTQAGFDPVQPWHIFLKVAGQPKQEVGLDFDVDLRTHGIEKLRLTPKDVNNGEAGNGFRLLGVDEAFLEQSGWRWRTVLDRGRRWLIIDNYQLPPGFSATAVAMALEIPNTYPGAQIDMFYVAPVLLLANGSRIGATETLITIGGVTYQRWSRHRGQASPWNPKIDNVRTHLTLVDGALSREVNQ